MRSMIKMATRYPWSVSKAYYSNVSLDVSSQEESPTDITFKSDGTKMYVVGAVNDSVYQYSLSTAWDLSTASYDSVSFSVTTQEAGPVGIAFKSDGTKMYVLGTTTGDAVYQYSLSTAWDLSTASYDTVSLNVTTENTNPSSIALKSDGTKLYVIGYTAPATVFQYTLSTAWDLSTATYDSVSFSVSSQETIPLGLTFKTDGKKMYVVGAANPKSIYQYSLSTAWDLSTASYDSVLFSISAQASSGASGIAWETSGTKIYMVEGAAKKVFQYIV